MRLMLKTGRCMKKSLILVAVWVIFFSVYSLSIGTVSFPGHSVNQGRIFVRKAASIETSNTLLGDFWFIRKINVKNERTATAEDILNRIHRSRAGNFTYESSGARSVFDTSRGQFSVIDKFLNKKEHGFFVEIGTDGNQPDSLTYLLEKSRGWTGLVIEPDSAKFESLIRLKRNSEFLQSCINVTNEDLPMNHSGIDLCLTLTDILKYLKRKSIDLLVLDAPGKEMQVLTSFPFKDVNVNMINIEVHGTNRYMREVVDNLKSQFQSVQFMTNHIYGKTDMVFANRNIRS